MNPPPSLNAQDGDSGSRLVAIRPEASRYLSAGKIDLNYRHGLAYGQSASESRPIPLDFCQYTTDTSINTLAAPLFRQVMCLRNDVHQGRVIFLRSSKRERLS